MELRDPVAIVAKEPRFHSKVITVTENIPVHLIPTKSVANERSPALLSNMVSDRWHAVKSANVSTLCFLANNPTDSHY